MLPVIVSDAVKFPLASYLQQNCDPRQPSSKATRPSSSQLSMSTSSLSAENNHPKDSITLYPITGEHLSSIFLLVVLLNSSFIVEFDRLLRRQQQLKQFSNNCYSPIASTSRQQRSSLQNSQHTSSSSTNGIRTSSPSLSIYEQQQSMILQHFSLM